MPEQFHAERVFLGSGGLSSGTPPRDIRCCALRAFSLVPFSGLELLSGFRAFLTGVLRGEYSSSVSNIRRRVTPMTPEDLIDELRKKVVLAPTEAELEAALDDLQSALQEHAITWRVWPPITS